VGCKVQQIYRGTHQTRSFYLNYVGCKGTCNGRANVWNRGFTLTMWDVKIEFS